MKRFLKICLMMAAVLGIAGAAEGEFYKLDVLAENVRICFDEPVVSASVVNSESRDISECLKDCEGPEPEVCWQDQDVICVSFGKGTKPGTRYCLELPEQLQYLSGRELPQRIIEFTAPPCLARLVSEPGLSWGVPGGSVLLRVEQDCYRDSNILSSSDVSYCFEVLAVDEEGKVSEEVLRRVPGKARAARVKELPEKLLADLMKGATQEDWAAVTPDSVVAGVVMVEPVEDLSGCFWRLQVEHPQQLVQSKQKGIVDSFPRELFCEPELTPVVTEGRERMYLELHFFAPVAAEEAEGIFRSLRIESGQHVAEASADGGSKLLKLEGQEIRFTYNPLPAHRGYSCRLSDDASCYVEQPCRLTSSIGMWVDGAQKFPVPLRLTLPAGTRAAGGLCMEKDWVRNEALNPLCPVLSEPMRRYGESAMRMPLHGSHVLKLRCGGVGSFVLRAARLNAWEYISCYDTIRHLSDERFRNLPFSFGGEKVFCAEASARWLQDVELPLDEVPGFGQRPGVYVIEVKAKSPEGVQILRAPGEEPVSPERVCYYVVHVTDLQAHTFGDRVLVTRLSDGSLVPDGEVRVYDDMGYPDGNTLCGIFPLVNGLAQLRVEENCYPDVVLAESGEDFTLAQWNAWSADQDSEEEQNCWVCLFTDRSLYRPGDMLHLCAMVRRADEEGRLTLPDSGQEVSITIKRNEKICHQCSRKTDEYGTVTMDWQLPAEAENAVGHYEVQVSCADEGVATEWFSCEVFRRDSFGVQSELEVDTVRPEAATLRVQALNYDGMPLADGVLQVNARVGRDMQKAELPLDAAGCATYEIDLRRRPEWADGEECELIVEGSIHNSRREYVRLPEVWKTLYPADFTVSVRETDKQQPVLVLYAAGSNRKQPLDREQELEFSLQVPVYEASKLPNGVLIQRLVKSCVQTGRVTVPADCAQGIRIDLEPTLSRLSKAMREKENRNFHYAKLHVSGVDPAGNKVQVTYPVQMREAAARRNFRHCPYVQADVEPGQVVVPTQFSSAGQAVVLLKDGREPRVFTVPVQAGEQKLRIPVPSGMKGVVQGLVLLPVQKDGCYSETETLRFRVIIPLAQETLRVEWQLPQVPQVPGSRVQLAGRVLQADGSPAAQAGVCLWVVDAGMLAVSRYTLPRPWLELVSGEMFTDDSFRYVSHFDFTLPWLNYVDLKLFDYGQEALSGVYEREELMFSARLAFNGNYYSSVRAAFRAAALAEADALWEEGAVWGAILGACATQAAPQLRPRLDFTPTPLWLPGLRTDAEGRFSAELVLPDTLTTYRVMAVVQGQDGASFGNGEAEFMVNMPVMLTPGTPLFMSTGDCLRLPVTITNNSGAEGCWEVSMQGVDAPQKVTLAAGQSATLYFDYKAGAEGECTLQWQATGSAGGDAVQGSFPVRFPAPVLQEAHHVALRAGDAPLQVQSLLSPELRGGRDLRVEVELSTNPLLALQGCVDFSLSYPYGCTEQRASNMLPWLLTPWLKPYCPGLQKKCEKEVNEVIEKNIAILLSRRRKDGGLSYWDHGESCYWASAHAALVLTLAEEEGYDVPEEAMAGLRAYLKNGQKELKDADAYTRYAVGRTCGDCVLMDAALAEAAAAMDIPCRFQSPLALAGLRLLADLRGGKANYYAPFNRWLRTVAGGQTHLSTWDSGWVFIALYEAMQAMPEDEAAEATLTTASGRRIVVGYSPETISGDEAATLTPTEGTVYVTVRAEALPNKTEFPGVTEKGLQITRIYEKRGEDGVWREAREFNVGDVVRVTLTCAKSDRELEYFVLEDYLPSCMEAINPNVPSQAAGLEWNPWSHWFDHKEYLSYRVRGFCTRWGGRDLLNMSYYARVKRAGTSIAPPAQGQLMYEPQTYGLSPNAVIISK